MKVHVKMESNTLTASSNSPEIQKPPSRVIHVIPHLGGGGTQRVVWTLLPLLDREVCEPSLCVLGSENVFPDRTARIQVDGFLGYEGSLRDFRGGISCVKKLRQLIESSGADIVHSHLWPAARVCSWALRGSRVRHVVHIHDTRPWIEGGKRRDRLMRMLTRVAMPGSQPSYIAVSEAVKRYCCGPLRIDPGHVRVIHNGVDLERFKPSDELRGDSSGRVIIGIVGLLKPEKGHEHLLRAAARLMAEGIDFEVRIAGDGSLRGQIEALTDELGLTERVRFEGLIEDVESFLHDLDIFVLPSVFGEGLPMTILEAMGSGIPTIASDVAGVCEVIDHEKNGLLVPPKDPVALANALRGMISSPEKRLKFAKRGLETVQERFSFTRVARDIERLYRDVTAE